MPPEKNVCQTSFLHLCLPLLWCVCLRKGGTRGAGTDRHTLTKTHTAFGLLMKCTKRQNIKMHDHIQPVGLSFRLSMQYFWGHGSRLQCICHHIARKVLMTYNNGGSKTSLLNISWGVSCLNHVYTVNKSNIMLKAKRLLFIFTWLQQSRKLKYLLTALGIYALVNGASRLWRAD